MIGKYDLTVAKKIWRDKLSAKRAEKFANVDLAIRDAQLTNNNDALKAAIAQRDELRALGQKIDSVKTIAELRKITLE